MAQVKLENIFKIFEKNVTAVNNVSLTIEDREFMVLVGPSGCGKSTTLRMIAGLEEISDGNIFIDDQKVNDVPPKDRDIAMVFQNYALYPHMTVSENMAFGLKLRKFPKPEIEQRVNEAAEILNLKEYLDRKPKALSGGQRQRVAVGRAIVRKPKVFLFDEPLSNLDAKLRVQMRLEISKLHQRLETTMIYVTHDQVEAMTMGDRITVMKDGVIQQVDTPLNLYNKPVNHFVAGFIGSPAMNFIEGNISSNGKPAFKSGNLSLSLPLKNSEQLGTGKKVHLGIRPEHILLKPEKEPDRYARLNATVEVVEPMGNELFIYTSVDGKPLVVRATVQEIPPVNSEIRLFLDAEKILFFDHETSKLMAS